MMEVQPSNKNSEQSSGRKQMKPYQHSHNLSAYSDNKYGASQQKSPMNISVSKEKLLEKPDTSTTAQNQPLKELHRN